MQMETEITVLVKSDYDTLKKELEQNGFVIKEQFVLRDIYLLNNKINISNMDSLDILKNCVLVREVIGIEMELVYKYKKYDNNGDILEQGKVECPITDVKKAIQFMDAIEYKELFIINDKCIVFANDRTELMVQLVNNKYIFIEMEAKCKYIDKVYANIDGLKEDICSFILSIDISKFFVKKDEIILNEVLNNN